MCLALVNMVERVEGALDTTPRNLQIIFQGKVERAKGVLCNPSRRPVNELEGLL